MELFIKRSFSLLIIFTGVGIFSYCGYNDRLNPNDPLSPDYRQQTVTVISNINVTLNYTNSTIIDDNTVWSPVMNPIKIINNILIAEGAKLTIEAGTEIEFYSIGGTEIGIFVDGSLEAQGTITHPIKFYAKDGALSYVIFRSVSVDSQCILKYCDMSQIFVTCIAAKPTIVNSKIMDLSLFSSSDLILKRNDIETLECYDSSPFIIKNLFYISSYKRNILIDGSSIPTIQSNNILGGVNYRVENLSSFTQTATSNYWGVTTSTEIAANIYDYTDSTNSGPVIYTPFFTNYISGAGAGW